MNQVAEFFAKLFNSADWPPRWHCGKWSDFHGWLYIISDLLIWSAYFTIPVVILRYILKKQGARFERLYFLFAGFILACGATHFLDAVAFWVPLYRLGALVRFITGVVSWVTVFYLIKLLPLIFSQKSQIALEAEILHGKQAEKRFKTLLEATPDALIIADKNGVITIANRQTEKLFGYTKSALIGKPFDALTSTPYKKAYARLRERFFLTSDTIAIDKKFELCGLQQNGLEFSAEVNVSSIQLEDGLYLCAAIRDVSERKKQERDISEMASIIASSSDAIISKNLEGMILTWNKGAEKILGYRFEEVKGKHISILFPPEIMIAENLLIPKILNGDKVEQYKTARVKKDGSRINVSITLSSIKNKAGKVVGISKILHDITQQKKIDLELQESNNRNLIFIQQSPNAIAMFDKEMHYLAASQKWVVDYKIEDKEILGHSHYEIFPEIGDDWKAIHQTCLRGEINQCDEVMFERADGSVQWLTWDVRPWHISENNIGGIIMYTADITQIKEKDAERKRIENILEISNRIAKIGTFEVNPKTGKVKLSSITNEVFELPVGFQYDSESLIKYYKKGERLDRLTEAIKTSMEKKIPYDLEAEIVTAKGNNRWLRIIGDAEFKKDECIRRFGVFQDITKSKKIEEELNLANEELSTILNAGYVSIIGADNNGLITHFSRGAEILLQYKAEEVIGIKTPVIMHIEEEIVERGKELSLLYGKTIAGNDVFTYLPRKGEYESREWTYVRKDGSTFPVQLILTAIKNQKDEITGVLGIATDITERKKTEEKLRNYSILESKSKEMEQFVYAASHDLREPLLTIKNYVELLIEDYGGSLDTGGQQYTQSILKAANHMDELIRGLLDYSRLSGKKHLQDVDCNKIVAEVLADLNSLITSKKAQITLSLLPHLKAYPLELKLLFQNLITNAIKFVKRDITPEINVSYHKVTNGWQFEVKDNGIGIEEKDKEIIFNLFQRLHGKTEYEGTGIGLAHCKKIVELHHGSIWVESIPGKSSTFCFTILTYYLPIL